MLEPDLEGVKETLENYPFPVDVIVEVTRYCNLACMMCPYPNLKRPRGHMSFETFKKIVDEVARENPATRIWLAIMGEPLMLGEDIADYIAYAKEQAVEEVCLNTNAVLLNRQMAEKLIESKLDKVLVSIDGFTKEAYDKIRIGGNFEKVYENVENFLKLKKSMKTETPEIITQFIVMEENEDEVELFKNYWLERDAIVKIRPKLGWGDAVESSVLDKVAAYTERFPCAWLTRTVSIHWDGSFSQCDADYEGHFSPGHLDNNTIKEVWETELATIRKKHWEGDYEYEPCKECKDWLAGRSSFFYPGDSEEEK